MPVPVPISSESISTSNIWEAAGEGDLDRVRALVEEQNLNPTVPDQFTYTPLHAAASYSRVSILRYLLQLPQSPAKAVDVTDSDGDTPLFVCEQRETAKVLVEEFGADFSHTNQEGQTALECAAENGHDDLAAYLSEISGRPVPTGLGDKDEEEGARLEADLAEGNQGEGETDRITDERAEELARRVTSIMERAQERQRATGDFDGSVELTADEERELREVVGESVLRQIMEGTHMSQSGA